MVTDTEPGGIGLVDNLANAGRGRHGVVSSAAKSAGQGVRICLKRCLPAVGKVGLLSANDRGLRDVLAAVGEGDPFPYSSTKLFILLRRTPRVDGIDSIFARLCF